MKTTTKFSIRSRSARSCIAAIVVLTATLATAPQTYAGNSGNYVTPKMVVGNWYLALDAGPFDPGLAGLALSGLAQIHADRTFMFNDAGDFGAQSFLGTVATPQYGVWDVTGQRHLPGTWAIEGTSLYLEADKATGEVLGWSKVQYVIKVVDRNHLEGTINAFFLPCGSSLPLPSPLSCPDPVANAGAFMPASPPDVPVTFTRISAGE